MKNDFLTIKQASQKYKVSASTITRFARKNEHTKFVSKENGKYLISDSLLKTSFEKAENHDNLEIQTSTQSEPLPKNDTELVTILKTQNEFLQSQIIEKDKQLNDKSSQIDKLLQRQYEQNSIIQTMQNRFDLIGKQIDNSTLLISEKVTQKNEVGPGRSQSESENFGFTIATAVMIILLVVAIIVFLTVK